MQFGLNFGLDPAVVDGLSGQRRADLSAYGLRGKELNAYVVSNKLVPVHGEVGGEFLFDSIDALLQYAELPLKALVYLAVTVPSGPKIASRTVALGRRKDLPIDLRIWSPAVDVVSYGVYLNLARFFEKNKRKGPGDLRRELREVVEQFDLTASDFVRHMRLFGLISEAWKMLDKHHKFESFEAKIGAALTLAERELAHIR